jgi:hypothetical protein
MADFTVRSDAVDVEEIMRQIRARIRDKRGVDYSEEQIQELAGARLEKFLDPRGVRSDLLEQYRKQREGGTPPSRAYAFEDTTLFDSDKAIIRFMRRLLKPILKLFFNYNVLNHVLHTQAEINTSRDEQDLLAFEVMHNLVVEMTRTTIEVKNLRMKLESVQSRLEFNERRARALEGVVQYKPEAVAATRGEAPPAPGTEPQGGVDPITGGDSLRTKRRRRRRSRRTGGPGAVPGENGEGQNGEETQDEAAGDRAPGSGLRAPGEEAVTPRNQAPGSGLQAPGEDAVAPRAPGSGLRAVSPHRSSADHAVTPRNQAPGSGLQAPGEDAGAPRNQAPGSRLQAPGEEAGTPQRSSGDHAVTPPPVGSLGDPVQTVTTPPRVTPREAIVPAQGAASDTPGTHATAPQVSRDEAEGRSGRAGGDVDITKDS